MEDRPARRDNKLAVIVIIAGLLTGAVITYAFLQPEEEQPRYTPEYPVVESQRMPLHDDETRAEGPTEPEVDDEIAPEPDEESESADAAPAPPADTPEPTDEAADNSPAREETTASERKAVEEARRRMEAQGVDDYAELTEELFIRVSAKMVLMASTLSESAEEDEEIDSTEVQSLLADNAADLLARERINPEDFWSFTRDVHSDPERAREIGEKILREAEKRTERKIRVGDMPGISPVPVPDSAQQ
jgi:type IV secretory pathway VirB10-like protein